MDAYYDVQTVRRQAIIDSIRSNNKERKVVLQASPADISEGKKVRWSLHQAKMALSRNDAG